MGGFEYFNEVPHAAGFVRDVEAQIRTELANNGFSADFINKFVNYCYGIEYRYASWDKNDVGKPDRGYVYTVMNVPEGDFFNINFDAAVVGAGAVRNPSTALGYRIGVELLDEKNTAYSPMQYFTITPGSGVNASLPISLNIRNPGVSGNQIKVRLTWMGCNDGTACAGAGRLAIGGVFLTAPVSRGSYDYVPDASTVASLSAGGDLVIRGNLAGITSGRVTLGIEYCSDAACTRSLDGGTVDIAVKAGQTEFRTGIALRAGYPYVRVRALRGGNFNETIAMQGRISRRTSSALSPTGRRFSRKIPRMFWPQGSSAFPPTRSITIPRPGLSRPRTRMFSFTSGTL